MKFADYIYSNSKKTQRPLNESKISDFIQDLYPFYAVSKIPKTLKITRYDLTDEGVGKGPLAQLFDEINYFHELNEVR